MHYTGITGIIRITRITSIIRTYVRPRESRGLVKNGFFFFFLRAPSFVLWLCWSPRFLYIPRTCVCPSLSSSPFFSLPLPPPPALNICNSFARLHTAHPLPLSSLAHPLFLHSLLLSVPRLLSSLYLFSFFLSFYPAAPRAGGLTSATFSPLSSCYVPPFSTFWFASCTSTPSLDLLHVLCSLIRLGLFHARSSELLRSCFSLSSINLAAPLSMDFSLFLWKNLRCPGPEIILPPGWNLLPSV